MRHTRYVKADTVNDTDQYQWGQFKVRHYAGQRIVTRLVGYRAQRASGSGERGGRASVYLTPVEWNQRHTPRFAQLMRKIRHNWEPREARVAMNRSVKTKGKRYQRSAPPRQFPTQIPTEHITCIGR